MRRGNITNYDGRLLEAIRRLGILRVSYDEIRLFAAEHVVPSSYKMSARDKIIMKHIANRYKVLIYYAIKSVVNNRPIWYFLAVSKNTEDWKWDRAELREGRFAKTYFYTETNPYSPDHTDIGTMNIFCTNGKVYDRGF